MKKILFIHHATGWGGAPINMINIINNFDPRTFRVEVLLIKDSVVSDKLREFGIKCHVTKSKFYRYYSYFQHTETNYVKWYHLFRFFKLIICWVLSRFYFASQELERFDYDIVHLNSSVLTDWLGPAQKKGKVVFHVQESFRRGYVDLLSSFFRTQMIKYANCIIAISQDNARRIDVPDKTKVIYNYAKIPQYEPPHESYHSKKVLYLGGASKIKGFYTLVEALKYLDRDVQVYFCGNFGLQNRTSKGIKNIIKRLTGRGLKMQNAIKKMRNSTNAIELGMIHNVDHYLDEVCCLVSPFSLPHFSRPVIEAHLHKKPAIGSDVEGMNETINHGVNGLLFEKDNPRALAKAINQVIEQPAIAAWMGARGYEIAIYKFSPENIHKFEEVYNSLL